MDSGEFGEDVGGVEEDGKEQRGDGGPAVGRDQSAERGAGINAQTAGADGERCAENPEGAGGVLVADAGEECVGGDR